MMEMCEQKSSMWTKESKGGISLPAKKQSFADAIGKLEEIVRLLEKGDVPLEDAITLYKEGMELSHFCHEKLQSAESQLISIVNEKGEKTPFEPLKGENETI